MNAAPPINWLDEIPDTAISEATLPLHVVVRNGLDRVISERFDDGQRFWSEAELSDKLKVSRVTVRRALDDLSRQGALTRFRAKGTFVRKAASRVPVAPLASVRPVFTTKLPFASIGVFVAQYSSQFSADFLDEFSDAAKDHEVALHVYRTQRGDTGSQAVGQLTEGADKEAIILFANEPSLTRDMYTELEGAGYKVVTVDVLIPDYPAPYVGTNNDMGIRLGLRHLLDLGHRDITFLACEPEDLIVTQARLSAFLSVSREQRIREMTVASAGLHLWEDPVAAAYGAMDQIWNGPGKRPTAIMCASDAGASGVLRWCAEHKVSVPNDLSLVGFDDDRSSQYFNPPLTTVAHPRRNIARRAVEILAGSEQSHEFLPPTLVVRRSTAAPREADSKTF